MQTLNGSERYWKSSINKYELQNFFTKFYFKFAYSFQILSSNFVYFIPSEPSLSINIRFKTYTYIAGYGLNSVLKSQQVFQ